MRYRYEKDVLGKVKVPVDAYYGSETQRALENFNISSIHMDALFIESYAALKMACAKANMHTGKLDKKIGEAIVESCRMIMNGGLRDQFVTDVFQAGAGTSTNMNVNEVIANLSIEKLGGRRGNYKIVHPNDHVNMSQSTNDTFHTVIHISVYKKIKKELIMSLDRLERSLMKKSYEFNGITKVGRTHLQDAVPITAGQEFYGYSGAILKARENVESAIKLLIEVPLGGTAVGTGINATPEYQKLAIKELNTITGERFRRSKNTFGMMQNQLEESAVSDALKGAAITLGKIANDVRLLASGPTAGINELVIPAVQPGSSIMPGKINPSIAEMVNMVVFQVLGSSRTIDEAAHAGQLELNVFMPVIAYNLLFSASILSRAADVFSQKCINGIKINESTVHKMLSANLSIATALTPYIGYAKAAEIARIAYTKNKSIKEVCLEMKIMEEAELDKILDPSLMV
jgi:aspartate ammonia-lyase